METGRRSLGYVPSPHVLRKRDELANRFQGNEMRADGQETSISAIATITCSFEGKLDSRL